MNRFLRPRTAVLITGAPLGLGGVALALSQMPALPALPIYPSSIITPNGFLAKRIDDSTPNAAQLRRGQYLVAAGDCMSCHLREGGEPLAGGLGLKTPFGVIYSPNITSDKETGIGNWTSEQFYHAMHDGIDDEGKNLYPAFPYPWFRLVSREDDDAILAFLQTTPAVTYTPPKNDLSFPLQFRFTVKGWNLLYFNSHDFKEDASQSPE